MSNILTVTGLSKTFGGLIAVNDVSFNIPRGKIFSIIGPNGAGKSTLFDLLTRVQEPDTGEIMGDSGSLLKLPTHDIIRHGIARTFQHAQLIETASVRDNVALGRLKFRSNQLSSALFRTKSFRTAQALEDTQLNQLLARLNLAEHADTVVSKNSTLLRQLTAIAMALASEPNLLLLDEPMGGLIENEVQGLMSVLRKLNNEGLTIVLIEHRMSAVMSLSDYVMVLNFGRRIALGTPNEIQRDQSVIEAYLGASDVT